MRIRVWQIVNTTVTIDALHCNFALGRIQLCSDPVAYMMMIILSTHCASRLSWMILMVESVGYSLKRESFCQLLRNITVHRVFIILCVVLHTFIRKYTFSYSFEFMKASCVGLITSQTRVLVWRGKCQVTVGAGALLKN